MAKETTYAGMLGDLGRITAALAANAAELPHLEGVRLKLDANLREAQEVAKQQAAFTAGRQAGVFQAAPEAGHRGRLLENSHRRQTA